MLEYYCRSVRVLLEVSGKLSLFLEERGLTMQTYQFLPQNRKSMLKKAVVPGCGAAVLSVCRSIALFIEKFFARNLAKHPFVTVIRTEGKNNLVEHGEVIA